MTPDAPAALPTSLGFHPLGAAAHSRPRERATRFFARLFGRQNLARCHRQQPPRAADRPVSHDVGFSTLWETRTPKPFNSMSHAKYRSGPATRASTALLVRRMVTRHFASVLRQQVLGAHSGHHMVTIREQIGG